MRHTQLVSKWPGTRRNVRLFWWSGSVVLPQLAFALIAINAYRAAGFPVVTTGVAGDDPRAFAQWLDKPAQTGVSTGQGASSSMLPAEGEVINLDDSVRRKSWAGSVGCSNGLTGRGLRNQSRRESVRKFCDL